MTRICPSKSRPVGKNSTGTLPNFKLRKTPTYGIIGEWEASIRVSKGGQWKLLEILGSTTKVPSRGAFPFLKIFSRSTLGVAKGSYGVDLVCFPLEAIAEIVESPVDLHQWIHQSGVTRCTVAIFDVLSSDAPSELVRFVIQSQGKFSILSPTMALEMLSPEVTSGLRQR